MRFPRGSASSLLSLAAGGIAAAAVAAAWFPMSQEAGQREAASFEQQLSLAAAMAGETALVALQRIGPSPLNDVAALDGLTTQLERVRQVSQFDRVLLLTPDGAIVAQAPPNSAATSVSAALLDACAVQQQAPIVTDPLEIDGRQSQAGCAWVMGLSERSLVVVQAGTTYQAPLDRSRRRAWTLLLGLGSLSGLVVILGMRTLLSPVQEVSEAAARIAAGARGIRVAPRGPDEIAQLAHAVNALASSVEAREDEIRGRIKVVTELSSMVAHEVRNPLQSLSLLCTLARTEPDEETRSSLLANVEEEIRVLEGVVQRFLRNSGPLQITRSSVDLVEVVKRAAAVAVPEARARRVNVMVQLPGRLRMNLDGSLIRRAMENLMLNGIEFAALNPPGQITASVLPGPDSVMLIVDDDGPGVPQNERDRVFEPYFSSKGGGTGLGLALVRQVFKAHGGTIRCEDSPLGGARFIATIPAREPKPDGGAA